MTTWFGGPAWRGGRLDRARAVTTDLSAEGAQRFAQVVIGTNAVRRLIYFASMQFRDVV